MVLGVSSIATNIDLGIEFSTKELAIEYAKGEIEPAVLTSEARKGGSIKEIKECAKKKNTVGHMVKLDTNMDNKLKQVANAAGEKPAARATGYVITGIKKDLKELED